MRYIYFYIFIYIFLCKKKFNIKLFFPYKNIFSANNVYFVKNIYFFKKKFFYQLSFATNEKPYPKCSIKKMFLEILQNPQENNYARVSFLIKLQASTCNFIKMETLAQVFFCELCEISKSTFSDRTPSVAAFLNADAVKVMLLLQWLLLK